MISRLSSACVLLLASTFQSINGTPCSSSRPNPSATLVKIAACGATYWSVQYSATDVDNNPYNQQVTASYTPRGTCGGSFYDCDDHWVYFYTKQGSVNQGAVVGTGPWELIWASTEYNDPVNGGCQPSDCCPTCSSQAAPTTYTIDPLYDITIPTC